MSYDRGLRGNRLRRLTWCPSPITSATGRVFVERQRRETENLELMLRCPFEVRQSKRDQFCQ
jgi:hypothetical protein